MYTIYSALAFALIITIAIGIRLWRINKLSAAWLEFILLPLVVSGVVSGIVSIFVGNYVPDKEVIYGPFPLAAARTSDGINGAFVWGSGNVGSQATYHILMRNANGSLSPYSINADSQVEIFEDAPSEHEGSWIIVRLEKDWTSPIANWATMRASNPAVVIKQKLHVPKGSIVQNFSLQ